MTAWSTPEQPEPGRLGVTGFMVVILFPGLVPDGELAPPGKAGGLEPVPGPPGREAAGL